MGVKEHNVGDSGSVLQTVEVLFRRAIQGEQAGQFYGSPVRLPGGQGFRTFDGQKVVSVVGTLEPGTKVTVRASNGDTEEIISGIHPETGEKCAAYRISFAMTLSTWREMQLLQGANYVYKGLARVNINALRGHGLEGNLWIEPDLSKDIDLFEAPQISGADNGEGLRASLAKGINEAEKGLAAANQRRHQRHLTRPANIRDKSTVAAAMAEASGMKTGTFAAKAAEQVGLPVEQIPQAPPSNLAYTAQGPAQPEASEEE